MLERVLKRWFHDEVDRLRDEWHLAVKENRKFHQDELATRIVQTERIAQVLFGKEFAESL